MNNSKSQVGQDKILEEQVFKGNRNVVFDLL